MARLPMPNLRPGNLRVLVKELHDLHARAGWPSTRDMARGQTFSHATVHAMFTKAVDEAPNLPVLLAVVEVLSRLSGRGNVDAALDKFDRLWRVAYNAPFSGKPSEETEAIDLDASDRIEVSFTHPMDPTQTATAIVSVDLSAGLIIERLIEYQFITSGNSWRGLYMIVDPRNGKHLPDDQTLREAGVGNGATLQILHRVTGG